MDGKNIKTLYKKEMLDVIRDKKTIIVMIVVPLIIYPLLFVFGIQLVAGISKDIQSNTYVVSFANAADDELLELFRNTDGSDYSFELVETQNINAALLSEKLDAYIEVCNKDGKAEYKIYYLSSVNNSSYAAGYCAEVIRKYSKALTVSMIEANGLDADEILNPVDISYADMSSNEETAGNIIGKILPYMLIISLLMGTVYPAIDITAGERERGTLETVLTLPITSRELIISKFLTVSTLGIITALLNVFSMIFVCGYMIKMMGSMGVDMSVDMARFLPAILVGVLCIFAFAVFMSAVTMCVCSFAKTYKEANNYITPLTLVVMFASFVAFLPNIALNERMALLPVANICLLVQNILVFKFDLGIIAIVLVSNIAYGIIAVMFLGKIYNSEAILFGDGSGTAQIFEKRSNMAAGGVPSVKDAWFIMAVMAVAIIYVGGVTQLEYGMAGVLITQLIIAGIPLAAAVYTKKDIRKTFRLKGCKVTHVFAAVLIIAGAMLLGMVVTAVMGSIFKESAENVNVSMESLVGDTFAVTLLVVAVAPAVCEELMFRGYILSAMETGLKPFHAILASAAFFGLYHMSVVKFFTTGLLGIFICYVAQKTGSLLPGMIMHFINNGISCVLMYYPEKASKVVPVLTKEAFELSDILLLLAIGALLSWLGIAILQIKQKTKEE